MLREMGKNFINLKELNAYRAANGILALDPGDESLRYCSQNELFDTETNEGAIEAANFYQKHPDRCVMRQENKNATL